MVNINIIEKKELFKGHRFNVERRLVKIDDKIIERDVVVFPESVVILPVLDDNNILLIKQYRPVLDDFIYEAPAGVVEPGEDIRKAAERELEEELGYVAEELIQVGEYYPVPGYSVEKMHFFIAKNLEYVGAKPEPYEVIEPITIPYERALEMIRDNLINDLKTIAIILYYDKYMYRIQID